MLGVGAAAVARVEDAPVEEGERRVDAVLVEPDRIGPWPTRARRRHDEVATADQGGRQEEGAFVVA